MELVQRLLDECNRLDVKMGLRLLHKYRSEKTIHQTKKPLTDEHKRFNQQALDNLVQDVEKLEELRGMMREAAEQLQKSQGEAGLLLRNIQSLLLSDFQPLSFEQEKIRVSIESLLKPGKK
jgi:3-methyladenine DNA glycosylase AlkC